MSFEGLLSGLLGSGGIPEAAASYVRGQVVTQGVRAGESANSILDGLSRLGIGLQRRSGLLLVRQERLRTAGSLTAAQLDLDTPVSELLGAAPPPGWTGQYVHETAITYRTKDAEGNFMLNRKTMAIKSSSILSAGDAVAASIDIISQFPADPGDSPQIDPDSIIAGSLTGAWYDTQGRNIPSI